MKTTLWFEFWNSVRESTVKEWLKKPKSPTKKQLAAREENRRTWWPEIEALNEHKFRDLD